MSFTIMFSVSVSASDDCSRILCTLCFKHLGGACGLMFSFFLASKLDRLQGNPCLRSSIFCSSWTRNSNIPPRFVKREKEPLFLDESSSSKARKVYQNLTICNGSGP